MLFGCFGRSIDRSHDVVTMKVAVLSVLVAVTAAAESTATAINFKYSLINLYFVHINTPALRFNQLDKMNGSITKLGVH